MFSLEDLDLHDCAADVAASLAGSDDRHVTEAADARLHPADYFIVGA